MTMPSLIKTAKRQARGQDGILDECREIRILQSTTDIHDGQARPLKRHLHFQGVHSGDHPIPSPGIQALWR